MTPIPTRLTDDQLLQRAIELAETHSKDGVHGPFGAVVSQDGRIVGEGWNRVVAEGDPTAHAEVVAVRDAARRLGTHVLEGCTIHCSCEPCPMCLGAIYWARISRIVYACSGDDAREAGFDDADIRGELRLPWAERRIPSEQRQRERGTEVLRSWNANPKRVAY